MGAIKTILFGGCSPSGSCAQFVYALVRAAFGLMMALLHGKGKVPPPEQLIEGVEAMGMPGFMAWGAALTEFVGGILIAIGFLTRPAAIALTVVMAVALFGAHGGDVVEGEKAVLFGLAAILFSAWGSGKYGLDAAFVRK